MQLDVDEQFLEATWRASMDGLAIDANDSRCLDAFDDCMRAYQEPHRAYHTLRHLEECLRLVDGLSTPANDQAIVSIALWFHDVVYDVQTHDNEDRSAVKAMSFLTAMSCSDVVIHAVQQLILATAHNAPVLTHDQRLLCDIDLAILGSAPERYGKYAHDVRHEYAFVPAALYAAKRIEILEGFLMRDRIYSLPQSIVRFEQQARTNISEEIRTLASTL